MTKPRNIRAEVLEAVDDGYIDSNYMLNALLDYMSVDDVKDCLRCNDLTLPNDTNNDD